MPSTIASFLARLDEAELRTMQSALEADGARVDAERARINVELEQIGEALARKSRPAPKSKSAGRRTPRPGATQQRILDAVARLPQPMSPAEIISEMEKAHGTAGNRGTIHNAIGRLVKIGELNKLDVGQYQLASRNGSSAESDTEPAENGASEPPFTAAQPQEGT